MLEKIESNKLQKIPLTSQFMWDFGDKILSLVDAVNSNSISGDYFAGIAKKQCRKTT